LLRNPQAAPAAGRPANPASSPAGRAGEPLFTVQDLLGWAYLYPVRGLFRILPVRFSGWLTRRLAPVYAWFRRDTRSVVERTMALAFAGRAVQDSPAALARVFMVRDARKVADDLLIRRLSPTQLARKARVRGLEHLQAACAEGRGVIVVSGHFHANRLAKYYLRRAGYPMLSVRRRVPLGPSGGRFGRRFVQPAYGRFLAGNVEDELYSGDADLGAGLLRRLRENGIVNIHFDAAMARERYHLPLLHVSWPFAAGFVRLAEHSGAPLLPMLCLGDSNGFEINFEPPIRLSGKSSPEECRARLQLLARRLEAWILANPEQWELWTRVDRYLRYASRQ
jgi:KDO2-lipid IV(A) lauroyltransferase